MVRVEKIMKYLSIERIPFSLLCPQNFIGGIGGKIPLV